MTIPPNFLLRSHLAEQEQEPSPSFCQESCEQQSCQHCCPGAQGHCSPHTRSSSSTRQESSAGLTWKIFNSSQTLYEALHRLDYTSDPKQTISQGHCSNKLDILYIILSQIRIFTKNHIKNQFLFFLDNFQIFQLFLQQKNRSNYPIKMFKI